MSDQPRPTPESPLEQSAASTGADGGPEDERAAPRASEPTSAEDERQSGDAAGAAPFGADDDADIDSTIARAEEAMSQLRGMVDEPTATPETSAPEASPAAADARDDTTNTNANANADAVAGSDAEAGFAGEVASDAGANDGLGAVDDEKSSPVDAGAISHLDQSLADEADAVLEGDFESVEEVLDDVFTTHAHDFDPSKHSKRAARRRDEQNEDDVDVRRPRAETPDEDAVYPRRAATASAPVPANSPPPPHVPKPDHRVISSPEPEPEAIVERNAPPDEDAARRAPGGDEPMNESPPAEAPVDPTPASEPLEVASRADLADESDAAAPEEAPIVPEVPVTVDAPETPAADDEKDEGVKARRPWWLVTRPAVIAILRGLSWPLRLVPPTMRPVVDLFALTLVFWIPIVWALALFIVG